MAKLLPCLNGRRRARRRQVAPLQYSTALSFFASCKRIESASGIDQSGGMSRGGYHAHENYPVPQQPQFQHPVRPHHPRPVTSDWDLEPKPNQFHAPHGAPIQQQQLRMPGAHPASSPGDMHPHAPRQHVRNFAGGEANHPLRGHDHAVYPHPAARQFHQFDHTLSGNAQYPKDFPGPFSTPQGPPPFYSGTAGQHVEDRMLQGYGQDHRLFAAGQEAYNRPSHLHHEHDRPQFSHAPSSAHSRPSTHGPPQNLHFQNGTGGGGVGGDDVVDVEGGQRFHQFQNAFHDHARPSTSPAHSPYPGQGFPPDDATEEPLKCGVGIVFHSGGHGSLAVKRLVPGGPAARCGLIKQGDILTFIDDTNVYQQSASDINHLISGPQGSFVRLRFKRSGSSPVVAVVERMWAPSTAERSKALSNGGGPPSKISPLLWLGDSSNSRDLGWLRENNVSFVLNCAAECANHHTEKLHYLHLRLLDTPEESIKRAFEPAFVFLQKAHEAGQVVYVHCAAGRSRSATLVIAYMMKSRRLSLRNAIYAVSRARPAIKPNIGFFQQLCRYEKELLGSRSCDTSDFTDFFK